MTDREFPDVSAVNRDFVRYDQVEKSHTYHLAETAGDEEFDDAFGARLVTGGLSGAS